MMAFDHVFWDVARRDSRAIETVDAAGNPATFVFREFYCTEPGCDCRRVVLHLHWVEGKRVAASINYAFEPSKRRDEPQIALDPLNPQSEYSSALLALFIEMIEKDREFRERLHRHYAMWKQVVEDPSHPDHEKVRGTAQDAPSFRPAALKKRGRDTRRPRGAALRARAGSQGLELVVAKAAPADRKLQQRFKRLVEKVDRLRQRLRAWKDQKPNIDRELAAYAALFEQQSRLGREMVTLLDRAYAQAGFSKADRNTLAAVIASLAGALLEQGGHDDLKSIYNRYSRSDFDAEIAADDAAGADALKAMLEMFGVEFGDVDVGSIEKLQAFTEAQLETFEQEEEAAQQRRAKRKKSARQLAAEERRAAEQLGADKAVQAVYRELAMALHPDREQDPVERTRKAELMREVNGAYEAKDLLRLLELQLQIERVDASRVEQVAEERVRHFNKILDEQSKQLAMELEEMELPFRLELDLPPPAPLAPEDVIAQIQRDADAVRQRIASLGRDLKTFEEMTRLKAWLKTQGRSRARSRGPEADLFGW